ncbi:AbrB/MazE/SpoVT family DNA-binding domain-containing protein [Novosphingobium colocasiae]|uniref:Addiction module antidote protein n=1 Tax=Novosphingobium colocasiae TaxID=1256513 RepID=A0A918PCS5_9SPHN|nr:AbrB/MazE/SpoVT family DNA-binding domain-containing protein [Novosphingobium colocasiae]GGY97280.1 addiction module antidote protein [Novosphingobium colocasiae]
MNKPTQATKQLKLIKIGNSTGVVLPKDVLDRLGLSQGDTLSVTNMPDGIALVTRNEQFDDQMAEARKLMSAYRNALRELAK